MLMVFSQTEGVCVCYDAKLDNVSRSSTNMGSDYFFYIFNCLKYIKFTAEEWVKHLEQCRDS